MGGVDGHGITGVGSQAMVCRAHRPSRHTAAGYDDAVSHEPHLHGGAPLGRVQGVPGCGAVGGHVGIGGGGLQLAIATCQRPLSQRAKVVGAPAQSPYSHESDDTQGSSVLGGVTGHVGAGGLHVATARRHVSPSQRAVTAGPRRQSLQP